MATFAFIDANIWIAEYDATCDTNQVALNVSFDELDDTTFCDTYRSRISGLGSASLNLNAYTSIGTGEIDPELFTNLNTRLPVTVCPDGATEGDRAYTLEATQFEMGWGAQVGQIHEITATAMNSGQGTPVVRGRVEAAKAARSSTATSTGSQLGALSASQALYSVLHVFETTGSPTLDVVIQSDDNSGFSSATGRITHTQATAATSEFSTVAGAITDDYWRASWTFGGTGTITFAVVIGIA
jgi:hypothetical protein